MSLHEGHSELNIVFIALSVSGQLNVHLATIEYMLTLGPAEAPPLHLHLLSFDPAEQRAQTLAESAKSSRNSLTFHSLGELMLFTEICDNGLIDRHCPATFVKHGGLKSYRFLAELFGFNPERYVGVYERILDIFSSIKPRIHIAAVDLTMPIGMDACMTGNVPWGILCPNSGLELSKHDQPFFRGFWKFPAPYSGIPYPVPVHLIPYNISLNLAFWHILSTHPRIKALEGRRSKAGIQGKLLDKPLKDLPFMICASVKEMEYPHVAPPNVVYPGPILVPVPPLSADRYPDLARFLDRDRTIILNMGSNFWYTTEDVESIATAIVLVRARCGDKTFQVLWKLNGRKSFGPLLERCLGQELLDTIRIEEWIEPPALAVLQHQNVVAFVNHGGANSVHEAAYAGVPQIILPQWLDLYDYAVRVEWLGHGIYANKGRPAKFHAGQLADAFVRILSDTEGRAIKERALEVAAACRRGGGVHRVAKTLLNTANCA
ncbi:glycosyltransferase family 1 protein [Phlebiopsis gigantea 11061_1 CR5-6]|uniref:Glycosyltransferase family 1 protein n=1 Tax=Phlebiopsis gigantea (strain 11061_1 CR5-6) TaxID=745531 RepID=A0A0C3PLL9_PHLG1|nr:glycosyltransferase family 1 protein [Phlebiopsis gigantea 11061_1 CR5-6]